MFPIRMSLLAISAGTALFAAGFTAKPTALSRWMPQDLTESMPKEVMARVTPGPQHEAMAWFLGDWDVAMKMTMPGMPEMPPMKSTCHYEWLIQGRWMVSKMKGSMMGMPAEWVLIHGYNNMTMNYETVAFDNMSTDAKISYGNPVTEDGKTLGFQGFMNEYLNGQIRKPFRTVEKRIDDNRFDVQIWDPEIGPNGAQVLLMEFTRKQG